MIIAANFNGPPGTANGGYAAGTLAAHLPGGQPVEITLRLPPPLDRELTVRPVPDQPGTIGAYDLDAGELRADELIAYGRPTSLDDDPVTPADAETAARAARAYRGFRAHPFPTCYVCGPLHPHGLRIFPGRLDATRTAAPFVVPEQASAVTVWAALDCPGGWTVAQDERAYVLGRIAARIDHLPEPGDRCVVVGELRAAAGRKAEVATSLYAPDGTLLATARATWLAVRTISTHAH